MAGRATARGYDSVLAGDDNWPECAEYTTALGRVGLQKQWHDAKAEAWAVCVVRLTSKTLPRRKSLLRIV